MIRISLISQFIKLQINQVSRYSLGDIITSGSTVAVSKKKLDSEAKRSKSLSESVVKKKAKNIAEKNATETKTSLLTPRKSTVLDDGKITPETLDKYPWILVVPEKTKLAENTKLICKSLGAEDINQFLPLLRAPSKRLLRLITKRPDDVKQRVYFFSKSLDFKPSTVAYYFADRLFMFKLNFDHIEEILNILLEFKIAPENILQDLWAFNASAKTVRSRLEQCQKSGKQSLKPWVVRCKEKVLLNSLNLIKGRNDLLRNDCSIVDYLSMRLKIDAQMVTLSRDKRLMNTRVQKVQKVLDYLLIEEKFETSEVVRCQTILFKSPTTIRQRVTAMKLASDKPIPLYVITQSKSFFERYLRKRANKNSSELMNFT